MELFNFHNKSKTKKPKDLSLQGTISNISDINKFIPEQMTYVNLYLHKIIANRNFYCVRNCISDLSKDTAEIKLHSNFLLFKEQSCLDFCVNKQIEVENIITTQMFDMNLITKNSPILNPKAEG